VALGAALGGYASSVSDIAPAYVSPVEAPIERCNDEAATLRALLVVLFASFDHTRADSRRAIGRAANVTAPTISPRMVANQPTMLKLRLLSVADEFALLMTSPSSRSTVDDEVDHFRGPVDPGDNLSADQSLHR
jgi:hypothetical protein